MKFSYHSSLIHQLQVCCSIFIAYIYINTNDYLWWCALLFSKNISLFTKAETYIRQFPQKKCIISFPNEQEGYLLIGPKHINHTLIYYIKFYDILNNISFPNRRLFSLHCFGYNSNPLNGLKGEADVLLYDEESTTLYAVELKAAMSDSSHFINMAQAYSQALRAIGELRLQWSAWKGKGESDVPHFEYQIVLLLDLYISH